MVIIFIYDFSHYKNRSSLTGRLAGCIQRWGWVQCVKLEHNQSVTAYNCWFKSKALALGMSPIYYQRDMDNDHSVVGALQDLQICIAWPRKMMLRMQ